MSFCDGEFGYFLCTLLKRDALMVDLRMSSISKNKSLCIIKGIYVSYHYY